MKIECLIKREGGTVIDMDGQQYHFVPDSDGRHVCEVTDSKHADRFKEITEGFVEERLENLSPSNRNRRDR